MKSDLLDNVTTAFVRSLARRESAVITSHLQQVFGGMQLSRTAQRQLRNLAVATFARGKSPIGKTGVVIAGFGDDEIFPTVHTFHAHALVSNKLLCRHIDMQSYSHAKSNGSILQPYGAVIPFAQTDVVRTFVNGVDPRFLSLVSSQISGLLDNYPDLVAEKLGIADTRGKKRLKTALLKLNEEALKNIENEFQKRIRDKHSDPLMDIVSSLPKDELANFASALVELTSIKRKMSVGIETVGGPVDVAIISKGDGFVWISRKHYFRPELNLQFSSNYFSGEAHDKS